MSTDTAEELITEQKKSEKTTCGASEHPPPGPGMEREPENIRMVQRPAQPERCGQKDKSQGNHTNQREACRFDLQGELAHLDIQLFEERGSEKGEMECNAVLLMVKEEKNYEGLTVYVV
jgi:hypothetical protein